MSLRILTWNIAWAYGRGSEGGMPHEGIIYKQRDLAYFQKNLNTIATLIRTCAVDVAILQEVDFNASRSCGFNQADFISTFAGLPHQDQCISWDHPYVPYPGLNPLNHFGRMKSGGVVMSRHPLKKFKHTLLPKPQSNSGLKNWFYLSRYLQMVDVTRRDESGADRTWRIGNLHLEAFDEQNRREQLQILSENFQHDDLDCIGGDFNGPISVSSLLQCKIFQGALTFPAEKPAQALDGFLLKSTTGIRALTLPTFDVTCSDHLPMLIEIN